MKSQLEILDSYASTFRQLINDTVLPSTNTLRKTLRLNKDADWDFLCTAMDIIDDASTAIAHIQRFGLSGPTKYDDMGERYLRLYGLLSATYIQQQAVLTMYKIMNVPNPGDIKKKLDALEIRVLRHKLAAHSTDYESDDSETLEAHVPLRFEINDSIVKYMRYTGGFKEITVNMVDSIDAHVKTMVEILDAILEKSIGTLYKGKENKRVEYSLKLGDLRIEKEGGMVVRVDNGPKIIVTFAPSTE
jgi:hypothetical protein